MAETQDVSGILILVPHIAHGDDRVATLVTLINEVLDRKSISTYSLWYYTPMALGWTRHLNANCVVYDCMDELANFKDPPAGLQQLESELFHVADIVFTGGQELFEAKRNRHHNIYPVPSSIDTNHFAKARTALGDPGDQALIPHIRLGYAGVIDERLDLELLAAVAAERPAWNFVMLGPVVKIDGTTLPRNGNIHYLGIKPYDDLPAYFAGWDLALMPFAKNDATRFISPTKTPEYLAAGLPVVSTSIPDVIRPYGVAGVVHVADGARDFIKAIERGLLEDRKVRLAKVDALLENTSWSNTWGRMNELVEDAARRRNAVHPDDRAVISH